MFGQDGFQLELGLQPSNHDMTWPTPAFACPIVVPTDTRAQFKQAKGPAPDHENENTLKKEKKKTKETTTLRVEEAVPCFL